MPYLDPAFGVFLSNSGLFHTPCNVKSVKYTKPNLSECVQMSFLEAAREAYRFGLRGREEQGLAPGRQVLDDGIHARREPLRQVTLCNDKRPTAALWPTAKR